MSAAASVLARLWGAYGRESLDGLSTRRREGDDLIVISGGHSARGPAAAAALFARPRHLSIDVDGVAVSDPRRLLEALSPASAARRRLADELDNCVANLALSRTATTPEPVALTDLPGRPDALAYLEQSIVDGHPLHPLCRTRMGMNEQDIRRYAPEFRPIVDLTVVDVPPERWLTTGTGLPPRLPMHPWQASGCGS